MSGHQALDEPPYDEDEIADLLMVWRQPQRNALAPDTGEAGLA